MPANKKLLILPGDGIGPEVMREVRRVIDWMGRRRMVSFDISDDLVGGAAIDARGTPITDETMQKAKDADAILFGSVGGPKWDKLGFQLRPELAILRLRKELDLFANLRPAIVLGPLVDASTLKPDVVRGLDLMIVRESTGGIYFGEPRGVETLPNGEKRGLRYRELYHQRNRARRARGVRAGAQAQEPRDQRGEGQRDAVGPVLAPDRHGAARAGLCRRDARPHVRGQLRHAACAQSATVRRDRHFQHLRRPAVGPGVHADRQSGHAARRRRSARRMRQASGWRCTSRSTDRRRISPARGSPIRWRRSSASPCCCGIRSAWRRTRR